MGHGTLKIELILLEIRLFPDTGNIRKTMGKLGHLIVMSPSFIYNILLHGHCGPRSFWKGIQTPEGKMIGLAKMRGVIIPIEKVGIGLELGCLLYTSPSPRDLSTSRMPSSA